MYLFIEPWTHTSRTVDRIPDSYQPHRGQNPGFIPAVPWTEPWIHTSPTVDRTAGAGVMYR